ncbi:transmembrane protein [Klebsiella pneumoniae]|nr:transmembrane protein [Klebsiella pneumoniae]
MNTSESDLINKTFYPGWLMVSQLRCGQPVTDGEALYRQACRWVTEAREALTAGGVSEASAEQMLYAYCALLDESVLNRASQDDGYRRWRKDPLQARFFSTLNAGEELWERIRQLLREPTADAAVLTCFYRTLQLGFVGQYRAEDDERREDVAKALGARGPAVQHDPGGAGGGSCLPAAQRTADVLVRLGGWHCGAGGAVVDLLRHAVTDGGADSRAGIRDA